MVQWVLQGVSDYVVGGVCAFVSLKYWGAVTPVQYPAIDDRLWWSTFHFLCLFLRVYNPGKKGTKTRHRPSTARRFISRSLPSLQCIYSSHSMSSSTFLVQLRS